jgi:hypothetical protein
MADQMTAAQIAAITDPALRAQVEALLAERNTLAKKVKEKSPTWVELGDYGKGKAGVQVSKKGQVQFTGTRKAYGGLYLFETELVMILSNAQKIAEWVVLHHEELKRKVVVAPAGDASNDPTVISGEGSGPEQAGGGEEENTNTITETASA